MTALDPSSYDAAGPLAGVRVLEVGQVIAGPFCGQMLGDLGADVVKVEPPGVGDVLRQWGLAAEGHDTLWWRQAARNKRSITIDLRTEAGQELLRQLADSADVMIENFRPGTLERWGCGYDVLSARNPGLVLVRVSGFGQDGPYATRAGYASIGEAMGGLRALVGYPDRPPARAGISLGDSLTGLFGALGALAALHERRTSGRGQVVDAAIYESVLALTESLVSEWHWAGKTRERSGPVLAGIAPSNVYPTIDGEILIAANQDTVFARLARAMDMPGLVEDERFVGHQARGEHMAEIDELIGAWSSSLTSGDLLEILHEHGVPSGLVYQPSDMETDEHFAARGALVDLPDETYGEVRMPAVVPRLSRTPGAARTAGPALGQHTDEVLAELGLDAAAIDSLREQKVI